MIGKRNQSTKSKINWKVGLMVLSFINMVHPRRRGKPEFKKDVSVPWMSRLVPLIRIHILAD